MAVEIALLAKNVKSVYQAIMANIVRMFAILVSAVNVILMESAWKDVWSDTKAKDVKNAYLVIMVKHVASDATDA